MLINVSPHFSANISDPHMGKIKSYELVLESISYFNRKEKWNSQKWSVSNRNFETGVKHVFLMDQVTCDYVSISCVFEFGFLSGACLHSLRASGMKSTT